MCTSASVWQLAAMMTLYICGVDHRRRHHCVYMPDGNGSYIRYIKTLMIYEAKQVVLHTARNT